MPDGYDDFIGAILSEIKQQKVKTVLHANADMICLYWRIGKRVLEKQNREGWGAKVIDRMSTDLRQQFPDINGFSPRNIKYMRKLAQVYPDFTFVQRVVAQIPWRTNLSLIDKLQDHESRCWYAQKVLEHGWSKTILDLQIETKLIDREGRAINNFSQALPAPDSDLVNDVFKDPYIFDFLGTDVPRRELEIEQKLTTHIQKFLLELGQGFAFVGRQVHLEIGNHDYYLDLLFLPSAATMLCGH